MNNSKRDEFLALAARAGELPTSALASAETFMDRALRNELLNPIGELDAALDAWRNLPWHETPYDYLGMTREEYRRVVGGDLLGVIADRKAQECQAPSTG